MVKEIFTAALGMQSNATRLEVVANNIANASTTGFKRASIFERNLIEAQNNFNNTEGDVELNDTISSQYYDFSPGNMQLTDNPLDLAIEGKGFFVLKDDDGKSFLTRAGNFRLSDDGIIISMDGKKLQGAEGPLSLQREFFSRHTVTGDNKAQSIRISQAGDVFVNDFQVGIISLVEPESFSDLERVQNSQFMLKDDKGVETLDPMISNIKQGWVEGSNVNVVQEMIQMIELQRMYDAGSKVIQTNDATLEKSISQGRYM